MLAEAIEYRNRFARSRPDDAANKLELARALDAAGRKTEALDQLAAVIGDRTTANTVRAQAAEVMGQAAGANTAAAQAATAALARSGGQGPAAELARAAVLEASGRPQEAMPLLSAVRGPLEALARLKLARLSVAGGRNADAISHFERVLDLDSDGDLSKALAFSSRGVPAMPRAALALLYSRSSRDDAALRIAGGDGATPDPQLARLTAALPQNERPPVFEPPPPEVTLPRPSASVKTVAELNQAAFAPGDDVVAALVDSALRLGFYDRARQMTNTRLFDARTPEQRASAERRLADIAAAERARQLQSALLLRVNRSNATESIFAARALD
jgi:tetratricopeptide (TPR) repeat protein